MKLPDYHKSPSFFFSSPLLFSIGRQCDSVDKWPPCLLHTDKYTLMQQSRLRAHAGAPRIVHKWVTYVVHGRVFSTIKHGMEYAVLPWRPLWDHIRYDRW